LPSDAGVRFRDRDPFSRRAAASVPSDRLRAGPFRRLRRHEASGSRGARALTSCGLDFGTSNTTIGTLSGGRPALAPLEGDNVTSPSAIFSSPVKMPLIGRAAIAAYVEGHHGRLVRSIKSVLGSSLLDEKTILGKERAPFRRVIADFLRHIKVRAEKQ